MTGYTHIFLPHLTFFAFGLKVRTDKQSINVGSNSRQSKRLPVTTLASRNTGKPSHFGDTFEFSGAKSSSLPLRDFRGRLQCIQALQLLQKHFWGFLKVVQVAINSYFVVFLSLERTRRGQNKIYAVQHSDHNNGYDICGALLGYMRCKNLAV